MPTVRVVQISDTHLGGVRAASAVTPEAGLEATVRVVAPLRPDLVLLTGDIADAGEPEAYREAAEMLGALRAPVLAVAGNHDLPQPMKAHFGGESERMLDAWRILTVDTYLEGEIHGEVDLPALLRRLGRDVGRPTLLAMHHPPMSPSSNPWFDLLGGADLVAALAERTDVKLVVGGHLHDSFRMVCGGVTYLGCPSTWYSLEHEGDEYRADDGVVGALRIDLFADGRFDVATVAREANPIALEQAQARPIRRDNLRLFDRYVMLRWTAADRATRGDDTIWRATLEAGGTVECVNHATRHDAIGVLTASLLAAPGERVFVGVDFPLGFPAGFAGRLASGDANWRAVWAAIAEAIDDAPTNENNRFAAAARLNNRAGMSPGPFWGGPADQSAALASSRPATFFGLLEHRLVERRLRERGHRPPSVWQLTGDGSVGSQALLGIPMLRRLSDHPTLGRRVRVWPFDTGVDGGPTRGAPDAIVIAQVWPDLFDIDRGGTGSREIAAVTAVCEHFAQLDAEGRLDELFVAGLDAADVRTVEREEGWILGA